MHRSEAVLSFAICLKQEIVIYMALKYLGWRAWMGRNKQAQANLDFLKLSNLVKTWSTGPDKSLEIDIKMQIEATFKQL